MTQTNTSATLPALVIRRTFDVPRERLWAAWTDPAQMTQWMGPSDFTIPNIEFDPRVGGRYRFTMRAPDGEGYVVGGEYREIVPPAKLVYTWQWEEDPPEVGDVTLVTVEFHDRGGKTELVLTHDQFAKADSRDRHEDGWNRTFDKLAAYVAKGA
ncbi:MAG: SRPBCC domain-containing protein [Candidatus Eremiobacteraeota bacterium]|nr:SRPBCC domain-containing protein [Candidatus Eremiobacteraeota bacterium]